MHVQDTSDRDVAVTGAAVNINDGVLEGAETAETEPRATAWMVARQATVEGALRVLQDEVAPAAPWQLQVGLALCRRQGQ